jgi:hypothetical protein
LIDELKKYQPNDHFFFKREHSLEVFCNAPKNESGVYVIYALAQGKIELIFIGSSGRPLSNGDFTDQKSGLYDRIVNGIQFDVARKKAWPKKMTEERIEALDIYWFVTFNNNNQDLPAYVEAVLLQKHYDFYGNLPRWNE